MFAPEMGQLGVFLVDSFPGDQTPGHCTQTGNAISAANTWGAANSLNPTIVFGAGQYCSYNQLQMPVNAQHWTWNIEGRSSGTSGVNAQLSSASNATVITETGTPSLAVIYHADTSTYGGNYLDNFYIKNITINANYKAPCMQIGSTVNVSIENFSCYEAKGAFAIAYADPNATGINGTGGSSAMTVRNSFAEGDSVYNFIPPVLSCPYSSGFVNGTACTVTNAGQFDSSQNNGNGVTAYVYGRQSGGLINPCTPNCTVSIGALTTVSGTIQSLSTVTENVTATNSTAVQVLIAPTPSAIIGQYIPQYVHDSTFIDLKAANLFQFGIVDMGGNYLFHPHAWGDQQVAIEANGGSTEIAPVADGAQRIGIWSEGGSFYNAQFVFAYVPPSGYTDWFFYGSGNLEQVYGDSCSGGYTPSDGYYYHIGYNVTYLGLDNPTATSTYPATWNLHGLHNCLTPTTPELDTFSNPVFTPLLNVQTPQTTKTGTTAGSVVWSEPEQGSARKSAILYLSGYENATGTAQAITLPASFATVGYVVTSGGSCAGVAISGATVTLPSSMGSTQTGLCKIEGY
jgi:hypothetical protein